MPNGISLPYQLDQSIFILRVVGWYISFLFKFLIEQSVSKEWWPWSDAAFCGIWSGFILFAFVLQKGHLAQLS